jgi:serine protease Do
VSFVGRHLQHYDLRVTNDFLQFSAPVNPGSSGSPVLDSQGRVVGVTTQHANSAQGISFAIPSKTLKWVLEEMDASADGRVQRGYLGIQFETRGADEHGRRLPGARVVDVTEGEPAHRAGLRPGDLVLFVDGNRIADAGDLHDRITRARPGRKVRLLLERDGQVLAPVVVELGDVAHGVGPGYSTPPGNG